MPAINNPVMGVAALIAAIVGTAPGIISSLSALPLRHELLAIKAQLQSVAIAT
jgi:hypothetical protein